MNIQEIKTELGVSKSRFNWAKDAEGVSSTEWLRAWDNDLRMDIHMHKDVHEALVANTQMDTLALQGKEVRSTNRGDYTFVRVVNHNCIAEW